ARGARGRAGQRPDHADPVDQPVPRHDAVRAGDHRGPDPRAARRHVLAPDRLMATAEHAAGRAPARRTAWVRPGNRRQGLITFVLLLIALLWLPGQLSLYWMNVLTEVTVYALVALGLGLLTGRVGLVSLGQIAV